ncbi:MAG: SpoIIE family protein phosphatase [Deltaproteobacteria bacterium]|nr:SpoIIE family protein phosphatase [Deltaproteobacteria bacterium]
MADWPVYILVVDDDLALQAMLSKILSLSGYRHRTTGSAEAAFKLLEEDHFDLIISDIHLPGQNGIAFMKEAQKNHPDLDFIIMTGYTTQYNYVDIVKAGASDYMVKPFEIQEVIAKVSRVIKERDNLNRLKMTIQILEKTEKLAMELAGREEKARGELAKSHDDLKSLYQGLRREHEFAQRVFKSLAKYDIVNTPNVRKLLVPSEIVGGDLFLVAMSTPEHQYFLLGDFTGHGLSAALGAIPTTEIYYRMTELGRNIESITTEINRKLNIVLPTGLFLCACLIELNLTKGIMAVWNGGLPDVLVVDQGGWIKDRFSSQHLPLAILKHDDFDSTSEVIRLYPGDRIYMCTDGLIEAVNENEDRYGQERLEAIFDQYYPTENLFDLIKQDWSAFRGQAKQSDDMALVEITYDPDQPIWSDSRQRADLGKSKGADHDWRLTLDLTPEAIRQLDCVSLLLEFLLRTNKELTDFKQDLYLIISELYTNAVDWGLLNLNPEVKRNPKTYDMYHQLRRERLTGLDRGSIRVKIIYSRNQHMGQIELSMEDSGPGFIYRLASIEVGEHDLGGRGISLVRMVCEKVVYQGRGNQVWAVYQWPITDDGNSVPKASSASGRESGLRSVLH